MINMNWYPRPTIYLIKTKIASQLQHSREGLSALRRMKPIIFINEMFYRFTRTVHIFLSLLILTNSQTVFFTSKQPCYFVLQRNTFICFGYLNIISVGV